MEPMSQTRRMREEFRVAIRRQKKQEIFRNLRNKNRVQFIEQEQRKMVYMLDTSQKREEWILRKARDLSGQPEQTWRFIMNELFWSILCFKGKGCFNIWIESGIIKSLCNLFHENYRYLNLGPEAAKLLGNIIFLEEEQEQEKASLVAKEIFEQEILQGLIEMIEDKSLPHSEVSFLVTLMGNLAQNEPGPIIKQGGMKACIDWSLRMLRQNKINRGYLDQIYSFFDLMCYNIQKIPTNLNFMNQVLKLYAEFIEVNQSTELLSRILKTIIFFMNNYKNSAFQLLLSNPKIMKRILDLSISEHEIIRELTWKIFAYLSSTSKVIDFFLNYYFMDVMWQAYGIQAIPNGTFDKITEQMLICIGNVAIQSDDIKDQILKHEVMKIIYDSTHEERSMNVKKNAYFTLCTFLSTQNYNICRKILYQTPIYEKLVLALDHLTDKKDAYTIRDILKTFLEVFRADRQVYRYHQEGILEMLETKYNLSSILTRIQQIYHENDKITRICDDIFDMSSTN